MPNNKTSRLALDRLGKYQIKSLGKMDLHWFKYMQEMMISFDTDQDEMTISILTGDLDQSALQDFLRHLYGHGIPLLSVMYLDRELNN